MLQINVQDCSGELKHLAAQFAGQLTQAGLSELSSLCLKIAKASCNGSVARHPAAMGIMLQCIERIERLDRGVETMRHPRAMEDVEKGLVEEAALLLATNGCSSGMMRDFGFSRVNALRNHARVDKLLEQNLPCPALALLWPDIIRQNISMIDTLIPRLGSGDMQHRFILCFDSTYLLPLQSCMNLHNQKGMVGGPFCLEDLSRDECERGSFQLIEKDVPLKERNKANRM